MGEYMYYKGEVYLKFVDSAVKQAYIKEITFLKELRNISVTLHCSSWECVDCQEKIGSIAGLLST